MPNRLYQIVDSDAERFRQLTEGVYRTPAPAAFDVDNLNAIDAGARRKGILRHAAQVAVDPLWYRRGCYINAACIGCARRVSLPIDEVAARYRIGANVPLYEILGRLRCSGCGKPPGLPDVTFTARWKLQSPRPAIAQPARPEPR